MGDLLSTLSSSTTNPSETQNTVHIPSSQTPESQSSTDSIHQPKTLETQTTPFRESSDQPPRDGGKETLEVQKQEINSEGEEEEEEEGECGFCLFMKGGGCKDSFVGWEKCVEEGEKNKQNIVDKCFEATEALKKCMDAHSDYYQPILRAEKAAEAEAVKELEREKKREAAESSSVSLGSEDSKKEGKLNGFK